MPVKLDPVTLEVIRNALPAISNEMAADLQRTSYNMMIYEVRDFCTALISAEGELISQNVGGVSHFVADLGVIITDGMQRYGRDGFQDGDVLIMNHPAVAGQHLNNICIYMPYFFQGELLMFSMVRAHWIDVGGMSTGFGAGRAAQDAWMEGLQFNQLKIYEGGKLNEMLHNMIKDNIRFPESSLGDLRSQIAACRLGNRRADELFERYGRDTVMAAIRQVFDETEQRCRNAVKQFADGVYEAESFIDDTGETPPEPVKIHAKITVKQGAMTIDLSHPDAGLELDAADRRRHDRRGARPGDEGQGAGRTSRRSRRLGLLRFRSQDQAPLRLAEHRWRRLGRAAA
jgi:N-methylhydantoinase B